MAEWLYEEGIGENRAALVDDNRILIAEIELPSGSPRVGAVVRARLVDARAGALLLDGGEEAALAKPVAGLSQGAALMVEIVREAMPERGRVKPAKAVVTDADPRAGPDLLARIEASGSPVRRLHAHEPDLLEAAGWSELLEEARTGDIVFPDGMLRLSVTPAMTLFDIDGDPPLGSLAVAAARAVAQAIVRHGIGGSTGIDFPTLASRVERQAVAAALDAALPQPFERTAVNGFGFLQIVRPRLRPSLPELLLADRAGAEARAALRAAERLSPPGPHHHILSGRAHRWLAARPELTDALARRSGQRHEFAPAQD
ncbi:ribonuclease [Sphingosinicella sp.]|uniref:ribonuclease n=1 Tax=Sphingosinicella sp. TaxID=1917971 RepID=UPI0040383A90